MFLKDRIEDPIAYRHARFVDLWDHSGRPYYNVYPSIIDVLTHISLEFPGTAVEKPGGLEHLLLRLPEDHPHPLKDGDLVVRSVFLSFQPCNRDVRVNQLEPGLVVGIDIGETTPMEGFPGVEYPLFTLKIFPLDERTVEHTILALPEHASTFVGIHVPAHLIIRCVKLAVAVCMLQSDPSILEPEVLNRDQDKLTAANVDELVARARRNGKYGFSLGKHIEVIPHLRRPHPALCWTGIGRRIPRIVFRKGSVVHREVLEKIPTGQAPPPAAGPAAAADGSPAK